MNITDRKFGIEIEFVGATRDAVNQLVNSKGVRCRVEGYNHTTKTHWKIVTDASVNGGGEMVSPILQGQSGLEQLSKVCEALQEAGARVNVQCGLHVHLDARDLTVKEIGTIYDRYAKYEEQIDLCLPRSRRNSRWCESTKRHATNVKQATSKTEQARVTGRYRKINLTNLGTTGSLEFRQHSGTIEFRKIGHWLAFLMQFVAKSQEVANGGLQTASIARNAWMGPLREQLKGLGWELKHKRFSSNWGLTSPHGDTAIIRWGVIEDWLTNGQPQTTRTVEQWAKKRTVTTDDAIDFIEEMLGLNRESILEMARPLRDAVEDNGWLDGVDTHTAEWLNQRQQELN